MPSKGPGRPLAAGSMASPQTKRTFLAHGFWAATASMPAEASRPEMVALG